jgi:hypothetical protein
MKLKYIGQPVGNCSLCQCVDKMAIRIFHKTTNSLLLCKNEDGDGFFYWDKFSPIPRGYHLENAGSRVVQKIIHRRNNNGTDSVEHVHSRHELMLSSVIIVHKIMYMRNPSIRQ